MTTLKRKIFAGVLIAGIAAFITVLATRDRSDRGTPGKANDRSQLMDADNNGVDFSAFRGKVVFVNNWASWCPPCIAEMPSIHELKKKLEGKDIVFVMVSYDEDPGKARSFMDKKGFDFDVYFPGPRYPYGTPSIPATFVLDKSGKTVIEKTGMADYSGEDLANQLKQLASE